MTFADIVTYSLVLVALLVLGFNVWRYVKGLKDSPRDMWFLFLYKFIEYVAYSAMNIALTLWLSRDCGLGDVEAGSYIAGWSIMLSIMGMVTGALVDTVGLKRILQMSILFLLIARFFMSWVTSPFFVFITGFLPLAIGFAIVGPLVSVAIKRFTTKEGAALGFGLFYVIMNMAYAVGGTINDYVRGAFALRNSAGKIINENYGIDISLASFGLDVSHHFSTYQLLFVIGFGCTLISYLVSFLIREGVEMTDEGVVIKPRKEFGSGFAAVRKAAADTGLMIKSVITEKYFWIFIGMLAITLFVRFVFFHFQYTFPKYGLRILGEGAKIASIYGVLNPVLIVFLVPFVATLSKKISSYRMMIVGSIISSMACFIAIVPGEYFSFMTDSVFGEIIFIKWLGLAPDMPHLLANPPVPEYWPLIVMIMVFTVGEAIWSPRLMQFTAEIAPKGKEGTYIALSVLPFFAAKFVVGPMSGLLLKYYVPTETVVQALPNYVAPYMGLHTNYFLTNQPMASYPEHFMIWIWIGGMAVLTPIGLLLFRNLFRHGPRTDH